jgi:hypothetical protein
MTNQNPLTSFMRQPKIYVRLPSNGKYWADGSIDFPDTGDFPVYSMTAKDELTFKTPDALLNGQAVVDVIQSCMPNIKDAWKTPNIDIDLILVAIRIATYGEMMEVTHTVPNTEDSVTHNIDLRFVLDQLNNPTPWEEIVTLDDNLECAVHPLTYKDIAQSSLKTFESQKQIQFVSDETLPEEQRIDILNKSVAAISEITLDLIVNSISYIKTGDTVVTETEFIREFLENADKGIFNKIEDHLARMKAAIGIKPLTFESSPENIALGAPEKYEMPLSLDQSAFFAVGS